MLLFQASLLVLSTAHGQWERRKQEREKRRENKEKRRGREKKREKKRRGERGKKGGEKEEEEEEDLQLLLHGLPLAKQESVHLVDDVPRVIAGCWFSCFVLLGVHDRG